MITEAKTLETKLSKAEVWALVHAERRNLLDDLAALSGSDWDTTSLCGAWTVHEVLAHLVDAAKIGKFAFIARMLRAKGDFDRANDVGVRRCIHNDPQRTLADFREALTLTRIPTAHRATRLVEAIVHGEDIRRPLGITREHASAGVHEALAYQLRTPASIGGSKERAAGCQFIDADTGVRWGDGSAVTGKAIDLLLAATGRRVEPGLLTGPGVQRLVEETS